MRYRSEMKRAAHKNAMFTITNIVQIFLADTRVIVYCITLLGVNKVVKTRRDVIKYLSGVNWLNKKVQLMSSRTDDHARLTRRCKDLAR